jgi:NitT/TauT family transport system ATP-binding protein
MTADGQKPFFSVIHHVFPRERARKRERARACLRPETPILPTRFHEEPFEKITRAGVYNGYYTLEYMSSTQLVTAHNIWRSFVDHDEVTPVLAGLSFTLAAGTITSLLGASGCGKTTLLKIVAGLDAPERGEIVSRVERPGPKLGYVQQGERLLPWRTLLGNVSLALELIGARKREAEDRAWQALKEVGLHDVAMRYPDQISGGMTQRVLLARAFITKPSLLLLDEPLGQLDLIARKELATIIRHYVSANQAAALLVTHSVEEAVFISDAVVTLTRRPARICDRFSLTPLGAIENSVALNPESSYETVQRSLMRALEQPLEPTRELRGSP